MSISMMDLVWRNFPRGGSHKLVMLALADWADDDGGRCYPSISAIAVKTCASTSQARRVVHELIEEGWLSVVGNAAGGAPGTTRQYRIHADRLRQTAGADASPTAGAGARPSTGARGGADARDGSHGRAETAGADASQTVIRTISNHHGGGTPPCPHLEIIELYNRTLPELPAVITSRWGGSRSKHLQARWRESPKHQHLAFWERFFVGIRALPWYLGNNDRGWRADLGWIVERRNFDNLVEKLSDIARRAP